MLTIRSNAAVLVGIVPVLALMPPVGQSRHQATTTSARSSFQVKLREHYGPAADASDYSVIVAAGRRSTWIFGGTNPGGVSSPVAVHWDGRKVTPVRLPARLSGFISAASAPSPDDVWAVSEYGGYLLHWNGRRWYVAKRWHGSQITGVAAASARDVWVFGATTAGFAGTGTWHYDGASWHRVRGLAGSAVRASAVSRRDIWAIGVTNRSNYMLHFNGSGWRRVRAGRLFNGVQLHDVVAVSNRNVWLAGNMVSRTGVTSLALYHWAGHGWVRVLIRRNALAGNLAIGRDGTVLLSATLLSATPTGFAAAGLIIQAWSRGLLSATTVRSAEGSGVSDVTLPIGAQAVWASGGILTRRGGDAMVWITPVARPGESLLTDNDLAATGAAHWVYSR